MKQLFYGIGIIVLIYLVRKVMAKVQDIPERKEDYQLDEISEDGDFEGEDPETLVTEALEESPVEQNNKTQSETE